MIDGGRYGSQTVDERAFRIQLPCDQESFLGDDQAITEPLMPNHMPALGVVGTLHASLDMSAYVLRVAAARRRALHFAFRASYQESLVSQLSEGLLQLQHDLEDSFADLPRRFEYNQDNMALHQQRLPMFILLHVYLRDPGKTSLINQVRRGRIARASMVASLVSEGLKRNVIFDPHVGVQAYVAIEILLLEPRRLAAVNEPHGQSHLEISKGLSNLLSTIRCISARSEFTKHLYLEAIHRLIRCDYMEILEPQDLEAIQRKNLLVGQDAAEFDFRDFRGAKLERLRKFNGISNDAAPDEVLLEDTTRKESEAVSRDGSAQTTSNNDSNAPAGDQHDSTSLRDSDAPLADLATADYSLLGDEQTWRDIVEPNNTDHLFAPFSWIWPFDEWGEQLATPTGFPSPVQHELGTYE
ncbi:uncharacterized protein BDV14DRAFT_205059 [Aspergillus stella-maris]|uniref:uncharacterized protein n=1 Tax=Aspergillus stella-maris TaxID=1810926 RepID=UPI003CCE4CB5